MQKHNVSFSNGNEKGNYYLSLSYLDNNGIVRGDADFYKRLTGSINADYQIKDWLKVGTTNQIENTTTANCRAIMHTVASSRLSWNLTR